MGYVGYVTSKDTTDILDMIADIKWTIGDAIEVGFHPGIPENEKKYILQDARIGIDVKGAYIHFYLKDKDKVTEFIINGIKDFEYEIYPTFRRYWVSTSEKLLNSYDNNQEIISTQNGDKTYRFTLFISTNK